jgi:hypothetical protein
MLHRRYALRVALCLLTGLVAVGCGSTSSKTHPSHTSSPAPQSTPIAAPSHTSSPAPQSTPIAALTPSPSAATVTVCQATAITGALGQSNGAAGTIAYDVVLTNTGTQPCTLDGYPTLQLVANGQDLSTDQMNGDNWLAFLSTTPELVTITARGGQASIVLLYSDVPGGTAACPGATQLEIGLPGGGGTVTSSFTGANGYPIAPCSGSLRVYPIMAGVVDLNP